MAMANAPHPAALQLRAHVRMLAETIGERNLWRHGALQRAADYIFGNLEANGYAPKRQTYEISRLPVSNIDAALAGALRSTEILVVGAHYDTVNGCPGANDNATGVAAILELARRFAGHPRPRTIKFAAFVNEEPPFFKTEQMGSLVYARAAKERRDQVIGMLSLETIGYYWRHRGASSIRRPLRCFIPMSATSSDSCRTFNRRGC